MAEGRAARAAVSRRNHARRREQNKTAGADRRKPPPPVRSTSAKNRVEELWQKAEAAAAAGLDPIRWHAIGTIQSRKAKLALGPPALESQPGKGAVCLIHAVDRPKIAQRLSRLAAENNRTLDVLLEVNVSGEATKTRLLPRKSGRRTARAAGPARTALLRAHDNGALRRGTPNWCDPISADYGRFCRSCGSHSPPHSFTRPPGSICLWA